MTEGKKSVILLIAIILFTIFISFQSVSADVAVANSEDWVDIYSVLLSEAHEGRRAFFLNSDSITSLTKIMAKDQQVFVYESNDPYINNLHRQLSSVGYDASLEMSSDSLNLDLDPQTGNYYVISRDNPRISISLASLAVKDDAWVFIVDDDNVEDVVSRLESASNVVGVGNFKRSLLNQLEPQFDKYINNNDIFKDSQELAKLYGIDNNLILADGVFLETEFFSSKNPVMLSGHNKILDDTYAFLEENDVKAVVIVGNELSVVGEQIRERSEKSISVFVKFGQSDTSNSGKVYALTMFSLPKPKLALTVSQALYDSKTNQIVATFENLGNAGIYELTTLSVKDKDGTELGESSNPESIYIAAGEKLPIIFEDLDLPIDKIDGSNVEFYTSFGLYPSELDSFLTMKNKFGPPFSIPLSLSDMEEDLSEIEVLDAAYYKGLKRVGVTIANKGEETVYYNLKINSLIVTGLEQDFFKADSLKAGEEKVTYLPVELDKIDLEENTEFNLVVNYGQDKDLLIKNLNLKYPFTVKSGGMLTALVAGATGDGSPVPLIIVIVVIVLAVVIYVVIKKKNNGGGRDNFAPKPKARKTPTAKKKTAKRKK